MTEQDFGEAIELPEKLDFRHPEEWKRWVTRWERYRVIPGLHRQDGTNQMKTLLHAMDSEAEDVLISFPFQGGRCRLFEAYKGTSHPRVRL